MLDLVKLGWPGQSTQTEGEKLYPYDHTNIQGKKCSNGAYQNQALSQVIYNHGSNNNYNNKIYLCF